MTSIETRQPSASYWRPRRSGLEGGSFADVPATNRETWPVPGATAVAVLYEFQQPGIHAYLNHNLIEAFIFNAVAHLSLHGDNDERLGELEGIDMLGGAVFEFKSHCGEPSS